MNDYDWYWLYVKEKNLQETKIWAIVFGSLAGSIFICSMTFGNLGLFFLSLFEYLVFLGFLDRGFMAKRTLDWEANR